MGIGRRIVRKSIRKATPRSVRKALHPVRTAKNALTPRPIKKLSRAIYTVTNPIGAAQNAAIGAILYPGGRRSSAPRRRSPSTFSGSASGSGVRAYEASESHSHLMSLMEAQHEIFAPVQQPFAIKAELQDIGPYFQREWALRKRETPFWKRESRKIAREGAREVAQSQIEAIYAEDLALADENQRRLDSWWRGLILGEGDVTSKALVDAFGDNYALVVVLSAKGANAEVVILLPKEEVLPAKKAHVTPTGRLSSKVWTKEERSNVYAEFIGIHVLATIRKTWAAAPSIQNLRILGVRRANEIHENEVDLFFDITVNRSDQDWSDNSAGELSLKNAQFGLLRTGKSALVTRWKTAALSAEIHQMVKSAGMELNSEY